MKKNMKNLIAERIKEIIFDKGIGYNFSYLKKWTTVNIEFYNTNEDYFDEVQFDIENLKTIEGKKELAELFSVFCEENDISIASHEILSISYVRAADSYEELMELEAIEEGYCFRED